MGLHKAKVGGSGGGGSIRITFSAGAFKEVSSTGMDLRRDYSTPILNVVYLKQYYKYAKLVSKLVGNEEVTMGSNTNAPVGYICPTSDLGDTIECSRNLELNSGATVEFYN